MYEVNATTAGAVRGFGYEWVRDLWLEVVEFIFLGNDESWMGDSITCEAFNHTELVGRVESSLFRITWKLKLLAQLGSGYN